MYASIVARPIQHHKGPGLPTNEPAGGRKLRIPNGKITPGG